MFIKVIKLPSERTLWNANYNAYPIELLKNIGLLRLDLNKITILYGSNGSGKSTILNLISDKISCQRNTPFPKDKVFVNGLGEICKIEDCIEDMNIVLDTDDDGKRLPLPSRRIYLSSDEVFKNIEEKKYIIKLFWKKMNITKERCYNIEKKR